MPATLRRTTRDPMRSSGWSTAPSRVGALAIGLRTGHDDAMRGLHLALVTCLLLARCTCEEQLSALIPDIDADTRGLEVSRQRVGIPMELRVQVGNRGTGTLDVDARIEPDGQGFAVMRVPDEIRPGLSEDVLLTFTPPAP